VAVPIQGWPDDPVERIKQSVALAEALRAQTVVVHPPERWLRLQVLATGPQRTRKVTLPLPLAGLGRLGRWLLDELPEFQAQTPVKIAVENMPCRPFGPFNLEPHHWSRPDQLRRFPYLTLDTTHVGTRRVDLLDFYAQLRPQVAHIHLSNYHYGREHQLLSQGDLPLTALLHRLAGDGFAGLIALELNTVGLQAEDMTSLRQNLRDSLEFCKAGLAQTTEGPNDEQNHYL
jgi:sugar phosphate isomerase/epimerase